MQKEQKYISYYLKSVLSILLCIYLNILIILWKQQILVQKYLLDSDY